MQKYSTIIGTILWGIAYAVPIGILFLAIFVYGIDVWHYERWNIVPLVQETLQEPTVGKFLRSFDTDYHRHVVVRTVQFFLIVFTNWNMKISLLIAPVLTMGSIALLHSISSNTFGYRRRMEKMALGFVAITLLCSLTQWEGWTRAFYDIYFSIFFFSAAAWFLSRSNRTSCTLFFGALCALLSSFSFSSGYFSWFALLPFFIHYDQKKWHISWKELLQWGAWFSVTSVLLFIGRKYHLLSILFEKGSRDPWSIPKLFAIFMGSPPVFNNSDLALLVGEGICIIFLLCMLWIFWKAKEQYKPARAWISFVLFAALCGLVIAPHRMSIVGVLSSRYIAFSSVGIIGLMHLVQLLQTRLIARVSLLFCWLALAFYIILIGARWYPQMQQDKIYFDKGKFCLLWYETAPTECLGTIHSNGDFVREQAGNLEAMGILR